MERRGPYYCFRCIIKASNLCQDSQDIIPNNCFHSDEEYLYRRLSPRIWREELWWKISFYVFVFPLKRKQWPQKKIIFKPSLWRPDYVGLASLVRNGLIWLPSETSKLNYLAEQLLNFYWSILLIFDEFPIFGNLKPSSPLRWRLKSSWLTF